MPGYFQYFTRSVRRTIRNKAEMVTYVCDFIVKELEFHQRAETVEIISNAVVGYISGQTGHEQFYVSLS